MTAAPRDHPASGAAGTSRLAVLAAALFSVAVWGGTSIVTKFAVEAFDPILIGILRSVVAGLAAFPFLFARGVPRPRGLAAWGLVMVNAASGFVLFPILFSLGQSLTTAGRSALILASIRS
jgi:drug/metabolite transporter (DMT)-like permease